MYTQRVIDRFWANVEKSNECWEWSGGIYGSNGYGRMWDGERAVGAHRVSYTIHHGPIAGGLFVLHHCDNPRCVRPEHLYTGTNQDNINDRSRRGRGCVGDAHWSRKDPERARASALRASKAAQERGVGRGTHNVRARLDEAKVRKIRELYADGFSQGAIAAHIGVAQNTISAVLLRKTWAHVE